MVLKTAPPTALKQYITHHQKYLSDVSFNCFDLRLVLLKPITYDNQKQIEVSRPQNRNLDRVSDLARVTASCNTPVTVVLK